MCSDKTRAKSLCCGMGLVVMMVQVVCAIMRTVIMRTELLEILVFIIIVILLGVMLIAMTKIQI